MIESPLSDIAVGPRRAIHGACFRAEEHLDHDKLAFIVPVHIVVVHAHVVLGSGNSRKLLPKRPQMLGNI